MNMLNMAANAAHPYGMREVRAAYAKNASAGLAAAVWMHMLALTVSIAFISVEHPVIVKLPPRPPIDIQPGIATDVFRGIGVEISPASPKSPYQNYTAIPDFEVKPDAEIPAVQTVNTGSGTGPAGTGTPGGYSDGSGGILSGGEIEIADPDPGAFQAVEKEPVPVRQVVPEYPRLAREAGVEGTVWVKVLVTKEGRVKRVLVAKSDSEIFNEAAVNAASQYLFVPAMMNTGPVAVWASIPFRFKLNR